MIGLAEGLYYAEQNGYLNTRASRLIGASKKIKEHIRQFGWIDGSKLELYLQDFDLSVTNLTDCEWRTINQALKG